MRYNFVANIFHTKKFGSRLSSSKCDFSWKTAILRFRAPPPLGLGTTYDVHLRLIGKRIADFLLVLNELFARCYLWGATSEYRLKSGDFAPAEAGW